MILHIMCCFFFGFNTLLTSEISSKKNFRPRLNAIGSESEEDPTPQLDLLKYRLESNRLKAAVHCIIKLAPSTNTHTLQTYEQHIRQSSCQSCKIPFKHLAHTHHSLHYPYANITINTPCHHIFCTSCHTLFKNSPHYPLQCRACLQVIEKSHQFFIPFQSVQLFAYIPSCKSPQ